MESNIVQTIHTESRFQRVLRNTAFGIFIGFEFALFLAFVLDSNLSDELTKFYAFLITASLSLVAATFTLVGVFANIETQQNIARQQRENKLAAAKAFLPSSLSKLSEICAHGIEFSVNFDEYEARLGREEFKRLSVDQLSLADEIISIFRDIIELTGDDVVTKRLSGMVREHQVFFARWKSEFADNGIPLMRNDSDFRQRTVAWAYLYAITGSVYDYARDETISIDNTVGPAEIISALNAPGILELHTEEYEVEIGLYSRTFGRRF